MNITKDAICAVVVTYNPASMVVANVTALLEQVNHVVVVDNGSSHGLSQDHVVALSQLSNVSVHWNGANLGIAAALNIGVQAALHKGYPWIATFDQDSTVTPEMFSFMSATYNDCPNKDRIAIICPRYRDQTSGHVILNRTRNMICPSGAKVFSTMTSGNLVNSDVFGSAGSFREELFIDLVDFEFSLRCGRHGYWIIEAQNAWLEHTLGSPTRLKLFGQTRLVSNHSAVRRYYWSRNMVWILRHYWKFLCQHPRSAWIELEYTFLSFVALVLFERGRRKKIRYVFRGLYHGLIGRLGPIERNP